MSHPSRPSEGAPAELLFLGCEGSGKSGLVRRIQRAAVTAAQGAAAAAELDDVSFAAAPTNGVERDEIQWRGLRIALKEYVFDVSNPYQLAESMFELASLLHSPQIATTPLMLVLNKIDAAGALSRAELQSSLRLDDVLSSARGGAPTPSMPPPTVVECSAVEGKGIEELMNQMAALAKLNQK